MELPGCIYSFVRNNKEKEVTNLRVLKGGEAGRKEKRGNDVIIF